MFKQKNRWIRFGCFLIGYNYMLLTYCSEASKKSVKKYTSAILIIMILWSLIGFLFSKEYLRLETLPSVFVGFILMIIIIQIERQIILGSKNIGTTIFRVILGLIMAILGAVIVDQIIFKEDILKEKLLNISNEVSHILPQKLKEINIQINDLDSLIVKKQNERELLIDEVTKKPSIRLPSYKSERIPTTTTNINGIHKDTIITKKTYTTISVENPKTKFIPSLDKQIQGYLVKKSSLYDKRLDIRESTEIEIKNTKGFLDELKIMFSILRSSSISMIIWILWLLFFLIIELFVLMSKLTDSDNDYEVMIKHQMNIKIDSINKITNFDKK
jgi:hypothetical protein